MAETAVEPEKMSTQYDPLHVDHQSQKPKSDEDKGLEESGGQNSIFSFMDQPVPEEDKFGAGLKTILRFPRSVWFIFGNEFCERYSYYGMKAILVLYFTEVLKWSDDTSTSVYHTFNSACYFAPLLGAIIADTWWGKYKTIIVFSIIYAFGHVVKSICSMPLGHDGMVAGTITGLTLIALGTGGIKPCVSAFGGDQIPTTEVRMREMFYSIFYCAINIGSLLAMIITPMLREDVQCFDKDCYPLAFGTPAAFFVLATIVFIIGSPLYAKVPPEGSILTETIGAISLSFKRRFKNGKSEEKFLYHAAPEYDKQFLDDIGQIARVALVFIPIPFFWMGYDQQGSTWTLQAKQMDGEVGPITIYPDQVQAINPVLILILIPFATNILYPILYKCRLLQTHLQKMGTGMFLAAIAFIMAGFVQHMIEGNIPFDPLHGGEASVWFVNEVPCNITVRPGDSNKNTQLAPNGNITRYVYDSGKHLQVEVNSGANCQVEFSFNARVQPQDSEDVSYMFIYYSRADDTVVYALEDGYEEAPDDDDCTLSLFSAAPGETVFKMNKKEFKVKGYKGELEMSRGTYEVRAFIEGTEVGPSTSLKMIYGGVYVISVVDSHDAPGSYLLKVDVVADPNYVSIAWQIPQYVIITLGEVMLSVTALDFAYVEVAPRLKSVAQAVWLLTSAFGNVLDIFLINAIFPPSRVAQFYICSGLMAASSVVFVVVAYCYNPQSVDDTKQYQQLGEKAPRQERSEEDGNITPDEGVPQYGSTEQAF